LLGILGRDRGGLSRDRGGLYRHRRLHRHGGGKPDTRPQAIEATGAKGPYLTYARFTILGLVGRRD
jgi:hypothetical protein